jgi:DNA-binding transcriptional MocR family regulator
MATQIDDAPRFDRSALATLAEQLAAWLAARIRERVLPAAARLPSVREAARRHGLAPSTVVAAYDLLQAQGLVEARAQRGFFVRDAAPLRARAAPRHAALPAPINAATLVRSMFAHQAGRVGPQPGIGTLPADWLDLPLLHSALRRALAEDRRDPASLRYGDPAGDPRLRGALTQRLADLGIAAEASQVVTTVGATGALELLSQLLLGVGDTVLVDDPGWPVEFARLAQMGVRCVPVPRAADGPDRAALRALLDGWRGADKPRVFITVSVLHNPSGSTLTLAAAHELLKIAEAHDLTVIEDDTYAWLAPAGAPRLCALDQLQRTAYVGGFAKILTPNWRVGYLAASPALAERAIERKLLAQLATPGLTERALAITLEQGSLRRHAERVTQRLDGARARSVRLARDAGFAFLAPPQGLYGWVDAGVDTEVLAARLHPQGWLLAPGHLFHAQPRSPQPSTALRINFASTQDARLWRTLHAACDEQAPIAGAAPKPRGAYHSLRKSAVTESPA